MKNPPTDSSKFNRRRFLAVAGTAALTFPSIIPSSALGRDGKTAPSNRISVAIIGWGFQGEPDAKNMMALPDVQLVAACDLDQNHLKDAVNTINKKYGNQDCRAYHDYRELLARRDIDAVVIAVPDHWHALVSVEAANQKKRCLWRKTARQNHSRTTIDCESGGAEWHHLADGFPTAFGTEFSQSGGNRAQWSHRPGDPRGGRLA